MLNPGGVREKLIVLEILQASVLSETQMDHRDSLGAPRIWWSLFLAKNGKNTSLSKLPPLFLPNWAKTHLRCSCLRSSVRWPAVKGYLGGSCSYLPLPNNRRA